MQPLGPHLQVVREGQLPAQIGQAGQREDVRSPRHHAQRQPRQHQPPVPRLVP